MGESERQRGRMQDAGRVRGREREVKREGWGSGRLRMGEGERGRGGSREEKGDTFCNCPDHLFV